MSYSRVQYLVITPWYGASHFQPGLYDCDDGKEQLAWIHRREACRALPAVIRKMPEGVVVLYIELAMDGEGDLDKLTIELFPAAFV